MDWKLLVLAPLCVAFLAGCGGHSDDDSHPHSPYAGLWVNEPAVGVLNECESGAFEDRGRVSFDAFRVRDDGQVNRYAFGNSPRADENLGIGVVGKDGAFQRKYSAPGATGYGFNYVPTQEEGNQTALQDGVVFMKDGDDKLLVLDNNGGSRVYIRGTDDDLRARHASILTCMGRYNVQFGQQMQQGPRYSQTGEPYYAYPPPHAGTPPPQYQDPRFLRGNPGPQAQLQPQAQPQELPSAPPGQYQEYQR